MPSMDDLLSTGRLGSMDVPWFHGHAAHDIGHAGCRHADNSADARLSSSDLAGSSDEDVGRLIGRSVGVTSLRSTGICVYISDSLRFSAHTPADRGAGGARAMVRAMQRWRRAAAIVLFNELLTVLEPVHLARSAAPTPSAVLF